MSGQKKKFYRLVLLIVLIIVCIFGTACYSTYLNPIIYGDNLDNFDPIFEEKCVEYSHTLMGEFLGIEIHAQFVRVKKTSEESDGYELAELLLISVFPPAITKVWYSSEDVPYWRTGFAVLKE